MARPGKRAKKLKAKLKKKLGFLPKPVEGHRFGSIQIRQDIAGKACTLGKTKIEIDNRESRQQKQRGWIDTNFEA